ncbi:MAG: AbrB/MazE/SpoVT family DNA-binding domain-containing protein [bacterium]|nr:AbrB/MazE/SpoVT family DNA-binding domain-containing protein [bacterium]
MAMTSTLTMSGQVSIPEEIRRQLHLEAGVELRCEVARGGILLRPVAKVSPDRQPGNRRRKISGLLRHLAPAEPVTTEKMNQMVEEAAVERYQRSLR